MSGGAVIIGAGQGGFQAAASLRMEGYDGPVKLIGDEPYPPYQRPPLSKEFLAGTRDEAGLWFRPDAFFETQDIALRTGVRAETLHLPERMVELSGGEKLPYDHLILATGARTKTLPVEGCGLKGVLELRGLGDARALKAALGRAKRAAVIGGGYIGLEVAAAARKAGLPVTVIEAQHRVLARVAPPEISGFFQRLHAEKGVQIELSAAVTHIVGEGGSARGIELADGRVIEADLVVIGIGVTPNVELAERAGLAVDDGIVVDERLRTAAPDVYAIGDCAKFPCRAAGGEARLESVQNAADQGRAVARQITGKGAPYAETPWFWTIQFDVRLQTAGLPVDYDQVVARGDPEGAAFSLFYYRGGKLVCVDSVDQPAEHMAARMMLTKSLNPPVELAGDAEADLRGWIKAQG